MRNIVSICRINLRRLFASAHFWIIVILSFFFMNDAIQPFRAYLQASNSTIGIFGLMNVLLNDATFSATLTLGCLGLLFNAPCTDEMQKYLLLRSGKKAWAKGQVLYCAAVCFLYLVMLTLICAILIYPRIDMTMGWSSGLTAFYEDFGDEIYNSLLFFDIWLPRVYSGVGAFALVFTLHFLSFFSLGMLLSGINVMLDRRAGFLAVSVPIAFDLLLEEYFDVTVSYFSPLTLCRLSGLDYGDGIGRPPVWFAFAALIVFSCILTIIQLRFINRREVIQ